MPQVQVLPDQMMNSVLGKLYDVLTMGDDTVPSSNSDFFSWCTPGIPYGADQLDFLEQGLTAIARQPRSNEAASNGEGNGQTDTISLQEKLGQQAAELYNEAESLARLVDFVPSVSGIDSGRRRQNIMSKVWNPDAGLSAVYEYILTWSQVIKTELDDKTKAKVEKLRGLLVTQKTKVDLITDEEITVTEPSEMVKRYYEKMNAYEEAALDYKARKISALAATSPEAVHFWAQNARTLRNRVRAAYNDWVANGYKDDFEKIAAFIEQVMTRDLTLLKAKYKEDLEQAAVTGLSSGSDFYYTTLVPGNFARSGGWTQFDFSSSDFDSHYDSSKKSWGASGGFSMGFFSIGGSASGSRKEVNNDVDWSTFGLSFKMAQVPIIRPWFHPEFLKSKYWRFHPNAKKTGQTEILSDGKFPPTGQLVAYPTAIVFIKDLELKFKTYSGNYKSIESSIGGGGGLGIGPFFVGGRYKQDNKSVDRSYRQTGQGIAVDGMQIAGFRCHLMPKAPDQVTNVKDTDWV